MTTRIEPYTEQYRNAVRDLIIPIQRQEFGADITYEDQPDLTQIGTFYQQGGGQFWIAHDGEEFVGTIALVDIGRQMGALRKMLVRQSHRGAATGVAHQLLDTLLAHAKMQGMAEIYLGTIAVFRAAHRFYEKAGFVPVLPDELPDNFPKMIPDTHFYKYRFED